MRLFKLGLPALVIVVLASWAFMRDEKFDTWLALSPAYLSAAEKDLATLPAQARAVAFCFELHRDGTLQTAEACKSFLAQHPIQSACAIQNLDHGKWDSDVIEADPVASASAIRVLAEGLQCKNIVIDFESLKNREHFSSWITAATAELHKSGFYISIAVHAKVDDAGTWEGTAAQDWPALCSSSDELLLMAYDFHFPGVTPAGEQAPVDWVEKVLRYARSTCATSHLRLGLAAYGYRWPNNVVVTEREENFAPGALPTAPDFVETTKARELKMQLARSYGVQKFFIWAMGMTADH